MTTITLKNKLAVLLCGIALFNLPFFTRANEMKDADGDVDCFPAARAGNGAKPWPFKGPG